MVDGSDLPRGKTTQDGAPPSPPRRVPASVRRAHRLHQDGVARAQAGQWRQALEAFRAAAKQGPDEPSLHYALGVALCRLERFDEAIEAFHREVKITPHHAPAIAEIGTCLARTGRPAAGIPYLQQALRLMPAMPLAHYSLGLALLTENRRAEAIEALTRAIELDGGFADAYRTRGVALALDGQFERSVDDLHVAVALDSDNYKTIVDLGLTFGKTDQIRQADRLIEIAAKISPDIALTQYLHGHRLIENGRHEEGLGYVHRAFELDPERPEIHVALGYGRLGQGRIAEAVAAFRKAGEMRPADAAIAGTLLFALQHNPSVSEAELLEAHRRWALLHRPQAPRDRLSFANDPDPARRPRLGIVSGDLHRHAVSQLTLRAFEALAAQGFELVCYKTVRARLEDDFSRRYRAAAIGWHDVADLDDKALAARIAEDKIDILFDLSGHTAGARLGIFANRAAPVQLTWAGYVGTVGLDTYEGLIADAVEIPEGHEIHYVEPVIRLPDCYVCYQPPAATPDIAPLPALDRGHMTFGCFNRPAKLNPAVGAAWARILAQVPQSRILLAYGGLAESGAFQAVSEVLSQGGVPMDRVDIIDERENAKLLQAYGRVDLALDPFPYSGGVTTLEAMWMGVPTITTAGQTFASRHSASHLTAAGLEDFCTADIDEYVALAVAWSRRLPALAHLRQGLRERIANSPLCDAPAFGNNLAAELTRLWRDWCASRAANPAMPAPEGNS